MTLKDSSMICTPKNSIISWLYTMIWGTLIAIVGFVVFIDAWSTPNAGVLLGFLLGGLLINVFLFLWVIFFEGMKNKHLSRLYNSENGWTKENIERWVYWAFDQYHFIVNIIFYLTFTIFYGIFLGIKDGFIAYQPLGLVPTPMQFQNMVIFKIFAFSFVVIAGFDYKFNFSTLKYVIIHMLLLHAKR
jgi:hypothetical protein